MRKILFLLLFLISYNTIHSQVLPTSQLANFATLKGMDVDNLTDTQVEQLILKMTEEGYTMDQIDQVAARNGMTPQTATKLKNRMVRYNTKMQAQKRDKLNKLNKQKDPLESNDELFFKTFEEDEVQYDLDGKLIERKLKVFGKSIFEGIDLKFEPSLRLATPENYIVGPDDELLIDVFGDAEGNYKLIVSPEGHIRIPSVGVVSVAGLTIAEVKSTLTKYLAPYYSGLETGDTKLSLALGDIRSISVNVIGEVAFPGTYTVSSFATVFNALYQAGGPTDKGSFRIVQIIRGGQIVRTVDLYDFLVFGKEDNFRLYDQDAIKVMPYKNRVTLRGEVKNEAYFEMKEGETLADLITYSGGFTANAYQARITASRNTTVEKSFVDVISSDYIRFQVREGDQYVVGRLVDRYTNRVFIEGAIYRPGKYAITEGMNVADLIRKAEGLLDHAFLTRALIFRKDANNVPQMVAFSPIDALEGRSTLLLQREDSVQIFSVDDMRGEEWVYVSGEVMQPNRYKFAKGMTVKDVLLMAKGVTTKADRGEVEVYRQVLDPTVLGENNLKATNYRFKIDANLGVNDSISMFQLQKNDRVVVRSIYGYEEMKQIKVEGEVVRTGMYVITSKNQRISDIISMAGGLSNYAYPEGAFLLRRSKKSDAEKELEKELDSNISTVGVSKINVTSEEEEETMHSVAALKRKNAVDKGEFFNPNDTIGYDSQLSAKSDLVGIDLKRIMANPGSKYDLLLEEGDVLNIPRRLETVQVMGEVMLAKTVRYDKERSLKSYVEASGGFSLNAKRNKTYVIHPNGSVDVTRSFMGFRKYPKVVPGSRIVVPEKPKREQVRAAEVVGITTSVVSVSAMIISLFR